MERGGAYPRPSRSPAERAAFVSHLPRTSIRSSSSRFHTAPMTWRDLSLPPAIETMLSLWFDAVFRGVREDGFLVEQGQFVRARMFVKRISAILRHCFVLLAVRVEIKARRAQTPPPLTPPRKGARNRAPLLPLAGRRPGGGGVAAIAPRAQDRSGVGRAHGRGRRRSVASVVGARSALRSSSCVRALREAQEPGLRGFDCPKSLVPGLGLRPPRRSPESSSSAPTPSSKPCARKTTQSCH